MNKLFEFSHYYGLLLPKHNYNETLQRSKDFPNCYWSSVKGFEVTETVRGNCRTLVYEIMVWSIKIEMKIC